MAALQKAVAENFLVALKEQGDLEAAKIEKIMNVLENGKRPKADDFVAIFKAPDGEEVE